MKESKIEAEVCEYAISRGWIPLKLTCPNMQGVADRLMVGFNGHILWIEFKTKKGKVSHSQKRFMNKLNLRQHKVHVIDDVYAGKELIDANT